MNICSDGLANTSSLFTLAALLTLLKTPFRPPNTFHQGIYRSACSLSHLEPLPPFLMENMRSTETKTNL